MPSARRSLGIFLAFASLSLLVSGPSVSVARAQDQTREPPPEAIEFFESGRAHYEAGRYREAAVDLERALTLDPDSPTLIFNLARVYELLGDLDRAIAFGRRYLATIAPDNVEERERAESTLRRMEGAQEWLALREAERPPELRTLEPTVIVRERGVADTPFWATLATGAGLIVVGAALAGGAWAKRNEAHDFVLRMPGDQDEQQSILDRAERLALSADVFLGAGVVTEIAALLLYLLRVRTYERSAEEGDVSEVALSPTGGPTHLGLALEGTF